MFFVISFVMSVIMASAVGTPETVSKTPFAFGKLAITIGVALLITVGVYFLVQAVTNGGVSEEDELVEEKDTDGSRKGIAMGVAAALAVIALITGGVIVSKQKESFTEVNIDWGLIDAKYTVTNAEVTFSEGFRSVKLAEINKKTTFTCSKDGQIYIVRYSRPGFEPKAGLQGCTEDQMAMINFAINGAAFFAKVKEENEFKCAKIGENQKGAIKFALFFEAGFNHDPEEFICAHNPEDVSQAYRAIGQLRYSTYKTVTPSLDDRWPKCRISSVSPKGLAPPVNTVYARPARPILPTLPTACT